MQQAFYIPRLLIPQDYILHQTTTLSILACFGPHEARIEDVNVKRSSIRIRRFCPQSPYPELRLYRVNVINLHSERPSRIIPTGCSRVIEMSDVVKLNLNIG